MSIPPISGNNNSSGNTSSPTNATNNSAPIFDTIEKGPSILEYMRFISSARNAHRNAIFDSLLRDSSLMQMFYAALSEKTKNITDLFSELLQLVGQWSGIKAAIEDYQSALETFNSSPTQTTLNNAVNTLNSAIQHYNSKYSVMQSVNTMNSARTTYNNSTSSLQSAINTMTTAVTNYNNGSITQAQFNQAISNYNSAVGSTVNNYNNAANSYNAAIASNAALNTSLTADGIPTIPTEGTAPLSGVISNLSAYTNATAPVSLTLPSATSISFTLNTFTVDSSQMATPVQTYNNAVGPILTAYQNAVNSYNTAKDGIATLNSALGPYGLSIPAQGTAPSPSVLSNANSLTTSSSPIISNMPGTSQLSDPSHDVGNPPDISPIMAQYNSNLNETRTVTTANVRNLSSTLGTDDASGDLTLPKAFIQRSFKPQLNRDVSASAGAGVGLATLTMGLSSPIVTRVLSEGAYKAILQQNAIVLPEETYDQFKLFALLVLDNQSSVAAPQIAEQLSQIVKENENNQPLVNLLKALGFVSTLNALVKQPVLDAQIRNFLASSSEFSSLPEAEQAQIVSSFSAVFKTSLLQLSLALISENLGTPGLAAQIAGSANGASPLSDVFGNEEQLILDQALGNPLTQFLIKLTLAEQLRELNPTLDLENAQKNVNAAVNEALALSPFTTVTQFVAALKTGLQKQGFDAPTIEQIIKTIPELIQKEGSLPLDAGFNPGNLTQKVIELLTQPLSSYPSTIGSLGIVAALVNALIKETPKMREEEAGLIINTAFSDLLKGDVTSLPQFSTAFSAQLVSQGLSAETAAKITDTAIGFINALKPENVPLNEALLKFVFPAIFGAGESIASDNTPTGKEIVANLSQALSKEIPNIGPQVSANAISKALSKALSKGEVTSIEQFSSQFSESLVQQGVPTGSASKIASSLTSSLKAAIPEGTSISNDLIKSLLPHAPPLGNVPGSQNDLLSQLLINGTTLSPEVLAQLLKTPIETNREFEVALLGALVPLNLPPDEVAKIANQFLALILPAESTDPLYASKPVAVLPIPQLAETIQARVIEVLTPTTDIHRARRVADQVVQTLIGNNSILDSYNTQSAILQEAELDAVLKEIEYGIPSISTPNVPVNVYIKKLIKSIDEAVAAYMNPALQATIQTSIAEQPTNFKRSIDIQV